MASSPSTPHPTPCQCYRADEIQLRIHGDATLPTLIYLPGLHGDWTLVTSFRLAVAGRLRFVEIIYPHTVSLSLEEHAEAVRAALVERGIRRGWLLGESFGSQIVWPLVAGSGQEFEVQGIILAGGFVRHSLNGAVRLAHFMSTRWPRWFVRTAFNLYGRYAGRRHRRAPETLASIQEFIHRRLEPQDRWAIRHRLGLIAQNDLRPLARQTSLPVFHLAGLIDPIVPVLPARLWLRRNCPGYRTARLIWRADHNVLGTAPQESAGQILQWMGLRGPGEP
jgi:pimeloyl-ACP methyl ester carboxylesterase